MKRTGSTQEEAKFTPKTQRSKSKLQKIDKDESQNSNLAMMNHLKKTYIPPIASNGPVKAKQMQNTHVHSGRRENKSKRRSEDTPNSNVQALKAKT